jgi:hypothetical protein
MNKRYIVRLTTEEREILTELVNKGRTAAYKIKHANILLNVDADGPNRPDETIASVLNCPSNTVRNVRQRFVELGLEAALDRQHQECPSRKRLIDGAQEARISALRCGMPPTGRARWSFRFLAERVIETGVLDTISHETVRQVLKKRS